MKQLSDLDYETIENAVMETARGRWFLAEYKKRNGVADTSTLLDAVRRLEKIASSFKVDLASPEKPQEAETAKPATPPMSGDKGFIAPANRTIAHDLAAKKQTPEPPASLSQENLQFFSNDEDLFSDDANSLLPDAIEPQPKAAKPNNSSKPDGFASKKDDDVLKAKKIGGDNKGKKESRFKVFRTDPVNGSVDASQNNDKPGDVKKPADKAAFDMSGEKASDPFEMVDDASFEPFEMVDKPQPAAQSTAKDSKPVSEPDLGSILAGKQTKAVESTFVSASKAETPAPQPAAPDPVMSPTSDEKDRIVIIRSGVDNDIEIPLVDDLAGKAADAVKPT